MGAMVGMRGAAAATVRLRGVAAAAVAMRRGGDGGSHRGRCNAQGKCGGAGDDAYAPLPRGGLDAYARSHSPARRASKCAPRGRSPPLPPEDAKLRLSNAAATPRGTLTADAGLADGRAAADTRAGVGLLSTSSPHDEGGGRGSTRAAAA
jgi:hypothetical protein